MKPKPIKSKNKRCNDFIIKSGTVYTKDDWFMPASDGMLAVTLYGYTYGGKGFALVVEGADDIGYVKRFNQNDKDLALNMFYSIVNQKEITSDQLKPMGFEGIWH